MTALSDSGTTLIGSNASGEILTASATGTDTLEAGSGSNQTLTVGGGSDTLIGYNTTDAYQLGTATLAGDVSIFNGTEEQVAFDSRITADFQNGRRAADGPWCRWHHGRP